MRARRVTLAAALAMALAASVVDVGPTPSGGIGARIENEAEALFLGRVFRRITGDIGRAVTRVANAVGRVATGAVKAVSHVAQDATKAIAKGATQIAKGVGKVVQQAAKGVEKGVKEIGKAAQKAAQQIVKGVKGVAELAKKGLVAVGEAVKKGLLSLKDLLGWVWTQLRDKLLRPIGEFFTAAINRAKAALQSLVDKALKALKDLFLDKVLRPALAFAMQKIMPGGEAMLAKVKAFVQRILGRADRLAAKATAFADVVEALAEKNLAKYEAALGRFDKALDAWNKITLADLAKALVEYAKERVTELIRSKTLDLLGMAYKLVEAPINAGKTAALAAISSIPAVGGLIAGAADIVITQGLAAIRSAGFDFVAGQAGKLAGMAVEWAGGFLVKGAVALDAKLRPIVEPIVRAVEPWVKRALGLADQVRAKWKTLRDRLGAARALITRASATVGAAPVSAPGGRTP